MLCRRLTPLVLLAVSIVATTARAEDAAKEPTVTKIYVSPNGNDAHSGRLAELNAEKTDGPLATLSVARDAVRKLKTDGQLPGPVRVIVADGTYTIAEPLVLTPEDSGTEKTPISYEAAEGAKPVISGGRVIGRWTKSDDGIWTTKIDDVAAGRWYFEQLFVNGRRAIRAREPNEFYFYMQDVYEEALGEQGGGRMPQHARQTIRLAKEDFDKTVGRLTAEELKDVQLQIYHKWDNTRRFVDRLDPEKTALVTEGRGMKPWNNWHRNTRFHLENFRAALDAPGEWFLARDGVLFYRPLPDEDMTKAEVVAPVAEKFLVVAGVPSEGKFVEHIALRGLNFRHGQWLTPPGGFEAEQAAASIEAALQFDGAKHITVENCEVGHLGTYAVWFRNACRRCTLRHCYLHDFGAGGARIGQKGMPATEAEHTDHIVLDNNIIRQGGYLFPCAVGVWIGFSGDNQVTHNEIADLFYTGISAGWNWGYGPSLAKRNDIGFNQVHHIGHGVLSDMGGIYTLGLSEGTRVHDNVFHDIYAYTYGGWGLYTDQASTGIVFENNLVCNTKTGGFHQHFGKENIVRNNILAFAKLYQLQFTRPEDHLSFTLENNIVYYDEGVLISGGAWKKAQYASRNNCFWNASNEPVRFFDDTLQQWQEKGHEQGSIVADPKFVDPTAGDYTLAEDSPALKLGFKPFDYTKAGVYGDEAWRKKAAESTAPPLKIAPPVAAATRDDFEFTPVGQTPTLFASRDKKTAETIVITDETAAEGKQSLKVTDAAGLERSYDPHFTYGRLEYADCQVENRLSLRAQPDTNMAFEWRDYTGGQYKPGPRFSVQGTTLILNDQQKIELPADQWVRLTITCDLAAKDNRGWTLRVDMPGQENKVIENLTFGNPGFRTLSWIGFMSPGETTSTYYLDDFRLEAVCSAQK